MLIKSRLGECVQLFCFHGPGFHAQQDFIAGTGIFWCQPVLFDSTEERPREDKIEAIQRGLGFLQTPMIRLDLAGLPPLGGIEVDPGRRGKIGVQQVE